MAENVEGIKLIISAENQATPTVAETKQEVQQLDAVQQQANRTTEDAANVEKKHKGALSEKRDELKKLKKEYTSTMRAIGAIGAVVGATMKVVQLATEAWGLHRDIVTRNKTAYAAKEIERSLVATVGRTLDEMERLGEMGEEQAAKFRVAFTKAQQDLAKGNHATMRQLVVDIQNLRVPPIDVELRLKGMEGMEDQLAFALEKMKRDGTTLTDYQLLDIGKKQMLDIIEMRYQVERAGIEQSVKTEKEKNHDIAMLDFEHARNREKILFATERRRWALQDEDEKKLKERTKKNQEWTEGIFESTADYERKVTAETIESIDRSREASFTQLETQELELEALTNRRAISEREATQRLNDIDVQRIELLDQQIEDLREYGTALTDTVAVEEEINRLLNERARILAKQREMATREQILGNKTLPFSTRYSALQSGPEGQFNLRKGMEEFTLSLGSNAQHAADIIRGTLGTALASTGQAITGLITGTMTWGEVFTQVGTQIVSNLIQIGVEMIAQSILRAALGKSMTAQATAEGASITAAYAPAAAAAGTATFGTSAAIGLAITLAAIAAIIAALSFAEGGLVPGAPSQTDNRIAMIASGEFVIPTAIVQKWGAGHFEAYRRGMDPLSSGPVAATPKAAIGYASGGLVAAQHAAQVAGAMTVNVGLLGNRQEMRDFAAKEGVQITLDALRRRSNRINA